LNGVTCSGKLPGATLFILHRFIFHFFTFISSSLIFNSDKQGGDESAIKRTIRKPRRLFHQTVHSSAYQNINDKGGLNMRAIGIAFIIVCASFFSGCASIMSGSTQSIEIDSDPKGATITVGEEASKNGKKIMAVSHVAGVTPLTVAISRKDGMIELSKEGYKTQQVDLKRGMNPWFLGDVVLTSLLSSFIDTSTGALHEYSPGQYMISLEKVTPENAAPDKAMPDKATSDKATPDKGTPVKTN
jgi:hypothetical protein